jgi:hypothetical protein
MVDKTLYKCTQKKQKVNNSNPTKTGDELGCFGKVSISCSTNGTCRVINYIMLWNYVVAVAFNGKEKPPTCLNSLSTHRPLPQVVTDKPPTCLNSLSTHRPLHQVVTDKPPTLHQVVTDKPPTLPQVVTDKPPTLPQITVKPPTPVSNHRLCLKSLSNHQPLPQTTDSASSYCQTTNPCFKPPTLPQVTVKPPTPATNHRLCLKSLSNHQPLP